MSMIETQESIPTQSHSSIFSRLWFRLTNPHSRVIEIGDRRRAQLLAGLSLILIFPLFFGTALRVLTNEADVFLAPQTLEFFGLILFSILAYIFSRTRNFQWGSYTLVTAFSIGAIINSIDSGSVGGALYF